MKSVCILLQNHYEPDIRVRRKAEALISAGYEVDVLALRSSNSDAKSYVLNGVTVHTVSLGKKRGSLFRYLFEYVAFFVWCFFKVMFLCRQKHYAVVDVNNLPDFLVFAATCAKWQGAKVVFDMHEITPEFYISKYGIKESSLVIRLLKVIERLSFTFADHVITINEPIRQLLISRGLASEKTSVVMNSVDEALFAGVREVPSGNAERKPGSFVMMYHGTLTKLYGLDIAIEAFGKAKAKMPGAEFWILGNGPEKASLENLCERLGLSEIVRFVGSVRPEEVGRWLNRCDIGVLPTRTDIFLEYSFSNKLSEYIIMGKGVIVAGLKAIRYYFTDEALAYFQPNSSDDLAKQMMRLYSERDLCGKLADQARHEYEPICWEVMKGLYLAMMAEQCGTATESERTAPALVASGPIR